MATGPAPSQLRRRLPAPPAPQAADTTPRAAAGTQRLAAARRPAAAVMSFGVLGHLSVLLSTDPAGSHDAAEGTINDDDTTVCHAWQQHDPDTGTGAPRQFLN